MGKFSSPYQLIVKEEGDENKEKYQLGDSIWLETKFSELMLKEVYDRL